ncbi:glycosyltransferase family 2 protein [Brachyspira pilosicoli]|uniref:glycosyltransferase family 2 protein n=1 Tax=Brachyspira pilosicoli TaxID=52584 RepID=UPI0012F4FF03|nr:glycosyltransferase family 2 protein [Brachyspira pilosicoli]
MIKVSVIIPVYNVEEYLKECLYSVINQTLKEIEIICIDDCSTDSSYSILEEYAKKDSRIVLIKNKENMGVGYNRNIGIKEAKGEYIGFIDSDDYISEDYYKNLYNTAKKYNSDVVNTLNIYKHVDNKINKFYYSFNETEFQSTVCLEDIENTLSCKAIAPYSVNKLYRLSFLSDINLQFITEKLGAAEDSNFTIKLMLNNPSISFNNKSIYYYRYTKSSLTNTISRNNILACISNMYDVIYYCENNFPNLLNKIYHKTWIPVINFYFSTNEETRKEVYKDIFKFSNFIKIDYQFIDKKSYYEQYIYSEYCSIIASNNYGEYLLNKRIFDRINDLEYKINNLKEDIKKADNWFRLFGINNSKDCLILILFGIKISIKKKNDKDI